MNDKNELGWGALSIAFICVVAGIVAVFSIFVVRP